MCCGIGYEYNSGGFDAMGMGMGMGMDVNGGGFMDSEPGSASKADKKVIMFMYASTLCFRWQVTVFVRIVQQGSPNATSDDLQTIKFYI